MTDAVREKWFVDELNPGSGVEFSNSPAQIGIAWDGTTAVSRQPQVIPFDGLLINRVLTGLPGQEFTRILPHLDRVSLSSNQVLYELGEEVDFVYFPETAVLSHMFYLEDGSSTGTTIVGNDGVVGLSSVLEGRLPYWTQVIIGGTAYRISQSIIKEEFVRGNAMQHLLLKYLSSRLAQLSQRAVCNGRHRLNQRFCTWLLMVDDRRKGHLLPLTHEEIANHLGTRRPSITGSCYSLRDKGIIRYRRGVIEILDREKLESEACECYRVLKI
jgi:CRP-like cAMP-binding protein